MILSNGVDPLIEIVAIGLVAIVFTRAIGEKAAHYAIYTATLRNYRLAPPTLVSVLAAGLLAAEVIALVLLLSPATRALGALSAIGLLGLYGAAMSLALLAGRTEIECGCGGQGQLVSWLLVARNAFLIVIAGVVVLPTAARALAWYEFVEALCAILIAWLLLATVEKAIELTAAIRRLETQSYL